MTATGSSISRAHPANADPVEQGAAGAVCERTRRQSGLGRNVSCEKARKVGKRVCSGMSRPGVDLEGLQQRGAQCYPVDLTR